MLLQSVAVICRHLQNNKVFFQHPDLMRILKVHENVMTVMMNVLGRTHRMENVLEEGVGLMEGAPGEPAKVFGMSSKSNKV